MNRCVIGLLGFALVTAVLVACGGDDVTPPPVVDAGSLPDGGLLTCGTMPPMEIGRCVLDAGGDCSGLSGFGEAFSFLALSTNDDMRLMITPATGDPYLVFLVRASGIDPGRPGDVPGSQPLINVTLFDATTHTPLAMWRARMGFTLDASGYTSDWFGVVFDPTAGSLNGRTITAVATLTDRNGEERCAIVDVVPRGTDLGTPDAGGPDAGLGTDAGGGVGCTSDCDCVAHYRCAERSRACEGPQVGVDNCEVFALRPDARSRPRGPGREDRVEQARSGVGRAGYGESAAGLGAEWAVVSRTSGDARVGSGASRDARVARS